MIIVFRCLILDEADRLMDMGYEKDVAAIVKAIEDHKKAASYDPLALIRQTTNKKVFIETEKSSNSEQTNENVHNLTNIFVNNQRQTILLSATLTKVNLIIHFIIKNTILMVYSNYNCFKFM